jgi:hypothetical protein
MIQDHDIIELLHREGAKLERIQDAVDKLPADDPHKQMLLRFLYRRASNINIAMYAMRGNDYYAAGNA